MMWDYDRRAYELNREVLRPAVCAFQAYTYLTLELCLVRTRKIQKEELQKLLIFRSSLTPPILPAICPLKRSPTRGSLGR
jgi:hypothetical protein